MPAEPRPVALPALTGVRFFAAVQVVLLHYGADLFPWTWVQRLVRGGYGAVSFFFVLSGFVLAYNYARPLERGLLTRREFWLARFARIYPLYAAMVLVEIPIMRWAMHAPSLRLVPATIAHLAAVQSWLPPLARWHLDVRESGFFKQEWEKLRPVRWTTGLATLKIPLFDAVPRCVHLRLESGAPRGTDLRVAANGVVLFEGHVATGPFERVIPLPHLRAEAPLSLEIRSSTISPRREIPGALDGRRLGIRVLGVELE